MATTDLTLDEVRSTITTLERSLGSESVVTVTVLADGRRVERQAKTDPDKYQAIAYFRALRDELETGLTTPRRLVLCSGSGIC